MSFRPTKPRPHGSTEDVVCRTYDEIGGVKQAAFLMHLSTTQAYAYADHQEQDQISYDQMRRLVASSGAQSPAHDMAALAGGAFIPQEADGTSFALLMSRSCEDWGRFVARVLEAQQDGELDAIEQESVARTLLPLVQSLASAYSRMVTRGMA